MDKSDPPESFGVFKPLGHTVIVFRTAADMLLAGGFEPAALVRCTPQEVTLQVNAELDGTAR